MPGLDGSKLAEQVRRDARWADLPIVAVTALGTLADLGRMVEVGFVAHVPKSINPGDLVAVIRRVCPLETR